MMNVPLTQKREVRIDCARGTLGKPMTLAQARAYGDRNMPIDLKRAGFKTSVFVSDPEINGGLFFRIGYSLTARH